MGIRVIITGVTGMVGEGVLLTCLADPKVEKVLVVGRRTCGYTHTKLSKLIVKDLANPLPAGQLAGYDSCYFCAGVTSVGKNEDEYTKLTYDMTIGFAKVFKEQNPNAPLTFCYISGKSTDSTEAGKLMWARVKGRTENEVIRMFGGGGYAFRPGIMKPIKGQKNLLKLYFGWQVTYPVFKTLFPFSCCELEEVGRAMIRCSEKGFDNNVLEVKNIIKAGELRADG